MTWIALGILSLFALSLIISSTRYRTFLGTVAIVAMVVVVALSILGPRITKQLQSQSALQSRPWLTWQFSRRPDLMQTADEKSEQLLAEMREGNSGDSIDDVLAESNPEDSPQAEPTSQQPPKVVQVMAFIPSGNTPKDQIDLKVRISLTIEQYLAWYLKKNSHPGVDRLGPLDLNWNLLKVVNLRQNELGEVHAAIYFDDAFGRYVQERGRQVIIQDRLKKTSNAIIGPFALLTTILGFLWLNRAKRKVAPSSDYLASSGISMM